MMARGMPGLASASPNQCRPKPGGGHAMKRLALKALIATISSGMYRKASDDPGRDAQADADPCGLNHGAAHHSDSKAPSRRATSRYTIMITIGTIE